MSATWTAPTDPTAGTPATATFMRTDVTQNLRYLKGQVDDITSGAIVKVAYKVIEPQAEWDFQKTLVSGEFEMVDTDNMVLIEVNYTVRREAESNFLDQVERGFRSSIEFSADAGSTWNRPAEYNSKRVTDPDSSLRTYSEAVYLRALLPGPASTFQVRSRHTAWAEAASLIAQDGGSWLTVMELEAVAL